MNSYKKIEYCTVFFLGWCVYMGLEIMWRGFTHWSMGVCGGLCFLEIYLLEKKSKKLNLLVKSFFGCLIITANELLTGCIVNIFLKWNVWDYSNNPFNLLGQICLRYSLLWFLLCIPVFLIAKLINNLYSKIGIYNKNILQ